MSKFDPKWPHGHVLENSGEKARIICTDASDPQGRCIVALVKVQQNNEVALYFKLDGMGEDRLINAPAPKKRVMVEAVVWAVRAPGLVLVHFRTAESGRGSDQEIIATIRLSGEIEEGATIEVKLP